MTYRNLVLSFFASVAFAAAATSNADAGGFLGDVAKAVGVPAAIVDPIDQGPIGRGMGQVYNNTIGQPIGQPAQPAAVAAPMPYCAFPDGQRFPLPPAAVPNGAPCWHAFSNGVFNGEVLWN